LPASYKGGALAAGIVLVLGTSTSGRAVADGADTTAADAKEPATVIVESEVKAGWVALPGVSYSPDDGLTLSSAVWRYFRVGAKHNRPSRMRLATSLSVRGAGSIDFDPDFWLYDDTINVQLTTKLSFVERAFYGIGNDTLDSDREDYESFGFQGRLEVARRLPYNMFIAGVYVLHWLRLTTVEEGGLLDSDAVVGSDGGWGSGPGVELRMDSRDSIFYPTRGVNIEISPRYFHRYVGSDFDYVRFFIDAAAFVPLGGDHVLATDFRYDGRRGDTPFDRVSWAGGPRLLRGMLLGRLRDDHYLAGQLEYRYPLCWRIGGAAFAGTGRVADRLSAFSAHGWKYSVGGGLRATVDREEHINVRLDIGVTPVGSGAYLMIGEAF